MSMSFAVLFPGQGSQFVGMGADLFDVRGDLLGETADRILGWSLRRLCLEGPEEELTRTEHAQPALFALSYALWDTLAGKLGVSPAAAAGHSLGEYTAICAAGMVDYQTGLRVVAERGAAMAAAADREPSGMAALIGTDREAAEKAAETRRRDGGRLWVANLNAPGQVVVAGGVEDLDWLGEHAGRFGIRRVVRLKVAGAFHSPFMEPAADRVRRALRETSFGPPRFPVYSNVTARPFTPEEATELLAVQVTSPVRFEESLVAMAQAGIRVFLHVGPGDVTAGMAKRSVPGATVAVVADLEGIDPALDIVSSMGPPGGE